MGAADLAAFDLPCLEGLEEWERRKIMMVLQRDLDIQRQKDMQIRRLRTEIEKHSEVCNDINSEKSCTRCRSQLGLLLNSGAPCPKCRARVCVSCRVQTNGCRLGWICILCDKVRQYAVLTGEWIQPDPTSAKRGRPLMKSNSALALRIRNPNRENDYCPATSAAKIESSISGILLRQLKEDSMHSWRSGKVDTGGFPPSTNRSLQPKISDPGPEDFISDSHRPRSPSWNVAGGRNACHQSKNANTVGSASGTHMKREISCPESWSSSRDVKAPYGSSMNPVPVLLVEDIDDDSSRASAARRSWRETAMEQRSLLNAFNRGNRCPSVPNQLNAQSKNDNPLTSLLSVHNVRVSVRSTSSDNVSAATLGLTRERNPSRCSSKQCSDNDIRAAVAAVFAEAAKEKRRTSLVGSKHMAIGNAALGRSASQTSTATNNDASEWDDNLSVSGDSVISLSSGSAPSSVQKGSSRRSKTQSSSSVSYSTKVPVQGEILLSCNYNCVDGSLEVHVVRCRNLYAMNAKKRRSNPYIKMYLLPDVSPLGKRKTRVKRRTVNPEFDEVLKFSGLTKSEVEARTLLITLWHCDVLNRSHFLGEIHMKLSDYPWIPGESYWISFGQHVPGDIEPEREIIVPEMMVSVKFTCPDGGARRSVSNVGGSLQCLVHYPQNLPSSRAAAGTPCYIKCYLYPDYRKLTKQKSPVVKLGADPTWSHTFVYDDVAADDLRERCLELTVWSHQRMGTNEFLGGIRLNMGIGYSHGEKVDWMDSSDEEAAVWKAMLVRTNIWVDATLPLRLDMESKL